MKAFDVVDRDIDIYQSHLLEASAGTGKTFSIENVVVRLLIERSEKRELVPLTIEEILVVTFTRAATRELKIRIRANIDRVLQDLQQWLTNPELARSLWEKALPPDYLLSIIEKGEEAALEAKKRLENALFCFDRAQIFTIHSFCYRILREKALESGIGSNSWREEDPMPITRICRVVKDFLRSDLHPRQYSPEQVRIVMKKYSNDADALVSALAKLVARGFDIDPGESFLDAFEDFVERGRDVKKLFAPYSEGILSDFVALAPYFKQICDRKGQVKRENVDEMRCFAELFDKEEWQEDDFDRVLKGGLSVVKKLSSSNENERTKGKMPSKEDLKLPGFFQAVQEELLPIVEMASSSSHIFARMGNDAQKLLKKVFQEEEVLTPDGILLEMDRAIENDELVEEVRGMYQAAVIDEFQDTDPIQWSISNACLFPRTVSGRRYTW